MAACKAYTIVEILITLAILAVLAALIATGLTKSLVTAKDSGCRGNLSQLHKALSLYQTDNNGDDPPYNFVDLPGKPAAIPQFKATLASYGMTDPQFYCPLDNKQRLPVRTEWIAREHSSYITGPEVGIAIVKRNNALGIFRPSLVATPSEFIYYMDQTELVENAMPKKRTTSHGSSMNLLFLDGHVKSQPVFQP